MAMGAHLKLVSLNHNGKLHTIYYSDWTVNELVAFSIRIVNVSGTSLRYNQFFQSNIFINKPKDKFTRSTLECGPTCYHIRIFTRYGLRYDMVFNSAYLKFFSTSTNSGSSYRKLALRIDKVGVLNNHS